jgi:N-acylneuraminate cytidylyltransferase/CMP-N,N'-diacetyllegionaminic acid synthase
VLLPTCPLRTAADIDKAVDLFHAKSADSLIAFTKEHHPIAWHRYVDEDGRIGEAEESVLANRQDVRPTYYPNGSIYVFRTNLLRSRKYYTSNSYAYIMPRDRSVDIDTLEDFEYAEFLLRRRTGNARP